MFKRVILYLTLIATAVLILFAVLNRQNTHSLIPLFGAPSGQAVEQVVVQTVETSAEPTEGQQETSVELSSDALQSATPTDMVVAE